MSFPRIVAIISLLVDAYLGLALIAILRMRKEYLKYLPPFGREDIQTIPRYLWMVLIAWTATLAFACLWNVSANRNAPDSKSI